jgi:uncharacterized protein YkwD/uncharacterized protein YukE
MKKYILLFILLFITVIAGIWYLNNTTPSHELPLKSVAEHIVEEVRREVNTPPLLKARIESPQASLTKEGVIRFTNIYRANNGLSPLSENAILNTSALKKARDMFEKQYFAHDSPFGVGVADLAQQEGYTFITIGENLALGNFLNDEILVQAWMDSPGHRENILNANYREIGIGVVKGTYEGKTAWMAVQHFGKPTSDCPKLPSDTMNQQIENNRTHLDDKKKNLQRRKEELEQLKERGKPEEYNKKAEEYNSLVEEYNNLLAETKRMIEEYNAQVRNFNQCALGD